MGWMDGWKMDQTSVNTTSDRVLRTLSIAELMCGRACLFPCTCPCVPIATGQQRGVPVYMRRFQRAPDRPLHTKYQARQLHNSENDSPNGTQTLPAECNAMSFACIPKIHRP